MNKAKAEFALMAAPPSWYEVAKQLRDQAEALRGQDTDFLTYTNGEGRRTTRSYFNRGVFLMAGFSIENLIKAYLVFEHPHYVQDGILARALRTHDLARLWNDSSHVPYKRRFASVVGTLADGLDTWARYPCGLTHERPIYELSMTPELWSAYKQLFDACARRLEKLLSKGWRDPGGELHRMEYRHG